MSRTVAGMFLSPVTNYTRFRWYDDGGGSGGADDSLFLSVTFIRRCGSTQMLSRARFMPANKAVFSLHTQKLIRHIFNKVFKRELFARLLAGCILWAETFKSFVNKTVATFLRFTFFCAFYFNVTDCTNNIGTLVFMRYGCLLSCSDKSIFA